MNVGCTRFHAIYAPIYVRGRVEGLLYDLFHGIASRDGIEYPFYDSYAYDGHRTSPVIVRRVQRTPSGVRSKEVRAHHKQILYPLDIQRCGWRVPDVTKPGAELVVSERVRNALAGQPNLGFLQVRFTKLIHYEYHAGDCPWPDEVENSGRVEEEFYDSMPDVPAYHLSVGPHYEIIIPSPIFLKKKYPEAEYRCVIGVANAQCAHGIVSPKMLEENAIISAGRGYFMSEGIFLVLEQYLDWDFFQHEEAVLRCRGR